MRTEINVSNARMVITRDELGFQEVIDDFRNAEYIYIITYNISNSNDELLDSLRDIDENTEIKLFTNIPNRFESYFSNRSRETARARINTYITRLDPETFPERFASFFMFNNHMKLVMTNNIAYLGSANYSDESANSFEAGFIFEDNEAISELKGFIDDDFELSAQPYYMANYAPLLYFIRELEVFRVKFSEEIWGVWDVHGKEFEYFKGKEINLNTQIVDEYEYIVDELKTSIRELTDVLASYEIDLTPLEALDTQLNDFTVDQYVIDYLEFDDRDYIDDLMQENVLLMTEDVLDDYVQDFTQQAFEIKDDLATQAVDGFKEWEKFLINVIQELSAYVSEIQNIINPRIDNTN
ncbi:hypothetical protein JOC25_002589 [Solibacillus kalamii]|uniref:PLD phosphodiesterase domain-containing protein n=1 Tax=Solibacillus kalamii TaxID=1748298 RepID=A0ABX3ZGZ9_9BACL|nr:hypothetical protein [Solibacillus kalamii]MBM7666096.1 hypothetical protein [Solibacillus kalamii]OUZ38594.1 hypothetical protein CBM15_12655 [Solibacillus kalamii]